ncbi:ATPase domain-containing protein [Halostella litorea]|uniref:ATPase domain-containing protein n=1 Tax=Halostella litorea TaxID=2528831 RepID=UPI00192A686E|nr:ATPase domain-containing protein [Halostella litorea]
MSDGFEGTQRCDFCRLPHAVDPVELEYDGATYEFCSAACRRAMRESDRVFTEYHGHRRFAPGVSALDASLPEGLPRNSFVMLTGQAGTRVEALHAELVWRTLRRDEPAVVVTFQEPPTSIVESFLTMEWNVLPYLESGQLRILDCFTYRVGDRDRMHDRMSAWNQHLHRVTEPATETVRDPSDMSELANKLDNCLEAESMVDTGVVVLDSLTELGTLVQPVQAYDFVKDVRADVCKGRFVPVFAGATFSGENGGFPHDLDYLVDGIVDLELNGGIVDDTLLRRVRIRKMSGVLTISEWTAFEYTSGTGLVPFDPGEEMTASNEDADGDRPDGDRPAAEDPSTGPGPDPAAGDAASSPASGDGTREADADDGTGSDDTGDVADDDAGTDRG